MSSNYCVIMAGGIGSRFWPKSKTALPKQFIDILGTGETLIQQTFNRIRKICPAENIFVVTNSIYQQLTLDQLPEIKKDQIICEPLRRNTAPCIAYANYKIATLDKSANIIVTPADHLILKEDVFVETLQKALDHTLSNQKLVTIGIHPSRPDTGYGYIQFDPKEKSDFKKVIQFTEKPDQKLAKQFVESGTYSWNSGMFIWSLNSIEHAMKKHLPEVDEIFSQGDGIYNTVKESEFIEKIYPTCPDISIDYGIMEKADNVEVINADFGWSDLGTWGSLYSHIDKDNQGNAIIGDHVFAYSSANNIVNIPKKKLAVLEGLEDYIVVDTEQALLVCRKDNEQQIKKFVNDIKDKTGTSFI